MATFINNEPSTFTVLQEKQVPQTFIDTIAQEIPASADVNSYLYFLFV
jgi:hypothetical protein